MAELLPRKTSRYGWSPDLPDSRDFLYSAPRIALAALPPEMDLRPMCPPVYDQGRIGSCTANAIGAAFEFVLAQEQLPDFMPSRLFIYYNERVIEHTVNTDAGAQIRDGIKCAVNQGACNEKTWPYNIAQFTKQPPAAAYQEAKKYQVTSYSRVTQTLSQLKGCLANGYPFVFGFTVYESFESQQVAQTGVMTMPAPKEKVVGGHAVLAVGYDDASQRFIIRNSWGPGWGQKGYFTMPYAYITESNLADDFWTIRLVED